MVFFELSALVIEADSEKRSRCSQAARANNSFKKISAIAHPREFVVDRLGHDDPRSGMKRRIGAGDGAATTVRPDRATADRRRAVALNLWWL
jgi:hypothetical protein